MLSEFCPGVYPWANITVALSVFTYGVENIAERSFLYPLITLFSKVYFLYGMKKQLKKIIQTL
jgi:hypothetical protein